MKRKFNNHCSKYPQVLKCAEKNLGKWSDSANKVKDFEFQVVHKKTYYNTIINYTTIDKITYFLSGTVDDKRGK